MLEKLCRRRGAGYTGSSLLSVEYRWSDSRYLIQCSGMSDASMGSFIADGKWLMKHGTPGASLVPFRVTKDDPPVTLAEALFLADCISYDHDMPTVVRPSANTPQADALLIDPVMPLLGDRQGLWYYDALEMALGAAHDVRVGEAVVLRYDSEGDPLANFSDRFSGVRVPLAMYAMARRQVDVLSEYLSLYRLLEWPRLDNGMAFVADRLDQVSTYDFGELTVVRESFWAETEELDVLKVYQERARLRVEHHTASGRTPAKIASHLYDLRNRIAHGKYEQLVSDFGVGLTAVAVEVPLVMLLARVVVEEGRR